MRRKAKIFVGGEWVKPHTTDHFEFISDKGEKWNVPNCDEEDLDNAISLAEKALPVWYLFSFLKDLI